MKEMVISQQHHDIDSVSVTMDCDANEAQMPADTMCDLNDTFGTEENFVNLWQSSQC